MSDGRANNPRFDERLSFTPEPGGPVDYASTADGPVQYVEVVDGQGTLGYLWFQDASDAADFIPRADRGVEGMKAGVEWGRRLRAHKESGLTPSRAVAELSAETAVPAGHVAPGGPSEAASDSALRALARGR
ncbi:MULTISPECIES: hypothetical protein [unclassified Streptomyces]|uniref:hypothetical protein n=1 Tax=unclassified Streptomyces TaxID=2593676 RepID=UPI0009A0AF9B|nr:hypothetical protein [Streptomyces sp. SAT1]